MAAADETPASTHGSHHGKRSNSPFAPPLACAERSARTISWARRGRRSGVFSRQAITSFASAGGASGRRLATGSGTSLACAIITACGVLPRNGGCPVSISYATQPTRRCRPDDRASGRPRPAPAPCRSACRGACRSRGVERAGRRAGVAHGLGDAEVERPPRCPLEEHHVVGLDVAVHHALRVRERQRVGHLVAGSRDALEDRQPPRGPAARAATRPRRTAWSRRAGRPRRRRAGAARCADAAAGRRARSRA